VQKKRQQTKPSRLKNKMIPKKTKSKQSLAQPFFNFISA
jgi:hypothetical protein